MGIRNIGEAAARDLAERFESMQALSAATEEQLVEIDGFGRVMAQSVLDFFASPGTADLLKRLASAGVNMAWRGEKKGDSLAGMSIVVTGTLDGLSRDEAEALIGRNGGRASGSVTH